MAPQTVVGIDPAAQRRLGLVRVRSSLVASRIAVLRLLGWATHLGEATENAS
jgi:hypothetical protein